jgi:hypothetical protein
MPPSIASIVAAALAFVFALPAYGSPTPGASDYVVLPEITFGSTLLLELDFAGTPAPDSGSPNVLVANMGGVSNQVSVRTALYENGNLLGNVDYVGAGLLAVFALPGVPTVFGWWPTVSVDPDALTRIFSGQTRALLKITPTFLDNVGGATYGSWVPHAARVDRWSLDDAFPGPTITKAEIVPTGTAIPAPSALTLLAAGGALLIASVRRSKRKQT